MRVVMCIFDPTVAPFFFYDDYILVKAKREVRMIVSSVPWGRDRPLHTSEKAGLENWAWWQNRINRASVVMLAEEGILSAEEAQTIARAQRSAEADQAQSAEPPFSDIMPLEKLLIRHCGQLATLIHTGRSRQDIFATINQGRLRRGTLDFLASLNLLRRTLLDIAEAHVCTWMPAYTNGVQAMPVTLGFYLWAFLESFERDADRLQQAWERINRSALGTAVLACSAWPLNRRRLAELLGFDGPIVNGLDSSQVSLFDIPIEAASICSNTAVRISTLMQDLAQQYAEPRPWLLLDQSAAYGSSAMPQKRNPGILNKTRAKAGDVIGAAQTVTIRAHNLPLGMYDNKESASEDNSEVLVQAVHLMHLTVKAFSELRVLPERALEELNSDWTCTMALAERLQQKTELPFRVGHTFASDMVTVARKDGWLPQTFPYEKACEIFADVTARLLGEKMALPLVETELRETLSPEYVVRTRVGDGAPNPESTTVGLQRIRARLEADEAWVARTESALSAASQELDRAFERCCGD